MSTLIACAVMDQKVGAFFAPIFVRSKQEAVRGFLDACDDPNLAIGKHPGDYQLYCVGSFDDQTGALVSVTPELLMQGSK